MLNSYLHRILQFELTEPSLGHVVLRTLKQEVKVTFDADVFRPDALHRSDPEVICAWTTVCRDPTTPCMRHELAEELVDLEDRFRRWRLIRTTTLERVIGFSRSAGETSGVSYLRRMLDVELFHEH